MSGSGTRQLGVDVGGTHIKWTRLDGDDVVGQGDEPTVRQGGSALVRQIGNLILRQGAAVSAVGLAMPGLVDTLRRETIFIPNIPGDWNAFPIAARVEGMSPAVSVQLINDARAFGYGEFHLGAGRDCIDAVFMTIGTGVGGALALNGQVVIGDIDSFPEVGHIPVEMGGERCGCGAQGCLETVASATAVVGRCARAVLTGQSEALTRLCGGDLDALTGRRVAEAADEGDLWALSTLQQAGTYLGMAAASVCIAARTSTVVVGGGLSGAFHHLRPAIEQVLLERHSILGRVNVVQAQLGSFAGSVGAAIYAQHRDNRTTTADTLRGTEGQTA